MNIEEECVYYIENLYEEKNKNTWEIIWLAGWHQSGDCYRPDIK